jgi:hypothetical protein
MKIENYLTRGFFSGLIAGMIGGLFYILWMVPGAMLGLPTVAIEALDIFKIDVFLILLGYSIPAQGICGSIYGIVYSRFYDRVPGKGIKKSFVWGCIIAFISDILISFNHLLALQFTGLDLHFINTYSWIEAGIVIWLPYGIFLGIIYERLK